MFFSVLFLLLQVLDVHQGFNDTSTTITATPTELSHKKNTIGKRINLNKSNVNSNTSDVVSNQSIINMDNNNHNTNNRKHGDAHGRNNNVYHSTNFTESDKLNNNTASDAAAYVNHNIDGDSTKATHMTNNVNKPNAKASGGLVDANTGANLSHGPGEQPNETSQKISSNERSHFNQLTGKLISSAACAAIIDKNVVKNVVSSNDRRQQTEYAHNHKEIVQYVEAGKLYFVLIFYSNYSCYFTCFIRF